MLAPITNKQRKKFSASSLARTGIFPAEGLLSSTPGKVAANLRLHKAAAELVWSKARSEAVSSNKAPPSPSCVKRLNISLFFDGNHRHHPLPYKRATPVSLQPSLHQRSI
ncbi:hypothetical protein [Halopseudomonas sp.]|uniref:hypothetical protein n=1 Tax=Halopseudomonas sp. TaxID=2901191 RepID=UPI003001F10E